jgi:hypothetical protein
MLDCHAAKAARKDGLRLPASRYPQGGVKNSRMYMFDCALVFAVLHCRFRFLNGGRGNFI